jgi:hypothetical protein
MTLGRLLYLLYYKPLALVRQSKREGGPINQLTTLRGRIAMQKAASNLPSTTLSLSGHQFAPLKVHILTGARFWYQSAFCARSLAAHSAPEIIEPVFYDDGTLGNYQQYLRRIFPSARFVSYAESEQKLDRILPEAKFPRLHERWHNYPNIRKLIDPHAGTIGWKLVLDSDMLFFRRPDFLLEWLRVPGKPIYMLDTKESYGYAPDHLANLANARLPECLNVGLCGLQSQTIDWGEIESWVGRLAGTGRTSYYLEQALVAMLVSGNECVVAPHSDYIAFPGTAEVRNPTAVMHHYVDTSKILYFRYGWRTSLDRIRDVNGSLH